MRTSLTLFTLALLHLTAFAETQEIIILAGNVLALKLEIPKDAKATTQGFDFFECRFHGRCGRFHKMSSPNRRTSGFTFQ